MVLGLPHHPPSKQTSIFPTGRQRPGTETTKYSLPIFETSMWMFKKKDCTGFRKAIQMLSKCLWSVVSTKGHGITPYFHLPTQNPGTECSSPFKTRGWSGGGGVGGGGARGYHAQKLETYISIMEKKVSNGSVMLLKEPRALTSSIRPPNPRHPFNFAIRREQEKFRSTRLGGLVWG